MRYCLRISSESKRKVCGNDTSRRLSRRLTRLGNAPFNILIARYFIRLYVYWCLPANFVSNRALAWRILMIVVVIIALSKTKHFTLSCITVFRAKNSGRRPAHNKPLLKPVSCIFGDLMEFGSVLRGVAELRGPWPMYICDCEQSTLATAIADKRRWWPMRALRCTLGKIRFKG